MKRVAKEKRPNSKLTKVSDIIPSVKENLDLDKSLNIMAIKEIWPLVTSFEVSKYSQPAYFDKDENIVIAVKSSTLGIELSMKKTSIVQKLKVATRSTEIKFKDIRSVHKSF